MKQKHTFFIRKSTNKISLRSASLTTFILLELLTIRQRQRQHSLANWAQVHIFGFPLAVKVVFFGIVCSELAEPKTRDEHEPRSVAWGFVKLDLGRCRAACRRFHLCRFLGVGPPHPRLGFARSSPLCLTAILILLSVGLVAAIVFM